MNKINSITLPHGINLDLYRKGSEFKAVIKKSILKIEHEFGFDELLRAHKTLQACIDKVAEEEKITKEEIQERLGKIQIPVV